MATFEVTRTLVKSLPEVWAELEKAERLAELIGDDAIKITKLTAEKSIEWESETARGSVEVKASGWGTKVRLTAEVEQKAAQVDLEADQPPIADAARIETARPPMQVSVAEPAAEIEVVDTVEPMLAESEIVESPDATADKTVSISSDADAADRTKRSLWQRIKAAFKPPAATINEPDAAIEVAAELELDAGDESESVDAEVTDPQPEVESDHETVAESEIAAEPAMAIEQDVPADPDAAVELEPAVEPEAPADRDAEIDFEQRLTAVLDHLGAAHKRPFTAA